MQRENTEEPKEEEYVQLNSSEHVNEKEVERVPASQENMREDDVAWVKETRTRPS